MIRLTTGITLLIIFLVIITMTKLTNDSKTNIKLVKIAAQQVYKDYPIVAQLAIAQAILEGGLRNSPPSSLALKYNNLFGIKGTGNGGFVTLPTTECNSKRCYKTKADFAVYNSVEDSFARHRRLMENGTKSNPARYRAVFKAKNLKEAATAVQSGGYATDKKYVSKLVDVYNQYVK